jgi:ribosome-binding factor A
MAGRRAHRGKLPRQYPRTARLNSLFQEILGDELELIDDERLYMVTVTSVSVEPDLRHALVYFDSLDDETDEVVLEALGELRPRLQGAVGRQARLKRVPELSFQHDPVIREGSKIEAILADIGPLYDEDETPPTDIRYGDG